MRLVIIILCLFPILGISQDRPNIILITTDDQGYGDISRNDTMHYTPIIDSLAANGAYFDYFYAQPACTPTRAELLTGKYAYRTGLHISVIQRFEERHVPLEEKLLPEYLQDEGYMTGFVGKWHLGHAQSEHLPSGRGFEYVSALTTYGAVEYFSYEGHGSGGNEGGFDLTTNQQPDTAIGTNEYLTFIHGRRSADFIEKNAGNNNPFFLMVNFYAPHVSNDNTNLNEIPEDSLVIAPTAGRTTNQRRKYVMLKMLDNEIGRIWSAVRDNGIEDNTIIILMSDNGGDTTYGSSNGNLTGKKGQATEGGMRVPFIWYHKNTVTPQVIDTFISSVDVMPAILSSVGANIPSGLDGDDITPLVSGGTIPARTITACYIPGREYALYRNGYKLCNNCTADMRSSAPISESLTMYNIRGGDPTESTNVIGSNTALRDTMQAALSGVSVLDFQTTGSFVSSAPPGWVPTVYWGTAVMFSNPNYYYYKY